MYRSPMSPPTPVVLMMSNSMPRSANASMAPDIRVMEGAVPLSTIPIFFPLTMGLPRLPGPRRLGQRRHLPLGLDQVPGHPHAPEHADGFREMRARRFGPVPFPQQAGVDHVAAGKLGPTAKLLLDADGVEYGALGPIDVAWRHSGERRAQRPAGKCAGEAIVGVLGQADGVLTQ